MRILQFLAFLCFTSSISAQVQEGTKYLRAQGYRDNNGSFKNILFVEKLKDVKKIGDTTHFKIEISSSKIDSFFVNNKRYYEIKENDTLFIFDEHLNVGDTFYVGSLKNQNSQHIISQKKKLQLDNGDSAWFWDFQSSFGGLDNWLENLGSLSVGFRHYSLSGNEHGSHAFLICQNNQVLIRSSHMEARCDSLYWEQRVNTPKIVKKAINIYPNPVKNNILFSSQLEAHSSYTIYSYIGQRIKYGQVENDKIQVNKLPKGTYFLIISSAREKQGMRFLKD